MHIRVLHKSFFQMICSYFNIAFLINQPSVDISKPILLRSTIPRIAWANAELFLFIFTTVFVTKSFLRPPRTPPFSPTPAGAGEAPPHSPAPSNQKAASHPNLHHFPTPSPKGLAAVRRQGRLHPLNLSGALGDELPCCPLWGKCCVAAKGVSLVTLSCYYSTNHTPSVSPNGLPAPPPGSRGCAGPLMLMNNSKTGA